MGKLSRLTPSGVHLSRNATGQGSCVQSKWQLLKAVEDIRETLGIKGTTIAVLRAALSYIRSDDICADRYETHVCFASNASLAERAHVSVQTVERHVAKLVALGLLERVSSGNGKRWARRDSQGRIVFATGLSLLPLQRRHDTFLKQAEEQEQKALELAMLRDRCAIKMAELVQNRPDSAKVISLQAQGRNILRRKPNSEALNGLLSEIIAELSEISPQKSEEMRVSGQHIEGHKETPLTPSVSKPRKQDVSVSEQDMQTYFPKLCLELRHAPSQTACQRQMDDLAQYLGLGSLWDTIKDMGPALSFMVLGYLIERVDYIQNPKAYAWRLMTDLTEGRVDWSALLRRPQKRQMAAYGVQKPMPSESTGNAYNRPRRELRDPFLERVGGY